MTDFFDINGFAGSPALAEKLGWAKIIAPYKVSSKDLQAEARRVRANAEVIIVSGGSDVNRAASDCWELDLIGSPELHEEKDFMHQMNSGIDFVIAKACAEKGIAIEFNFADVLNSSGRKRSQLLARMMQNIMISKDCGCGMVLTSGSKDEFGLRSPRDLIAFGMVIGMSLEEATAAVSRTPSSIIRRSHDRKDPNIIMKGLEVKKWGSEKKGKKAYGWY